MTTLTGKIQISCIKCLVELGEKIMKVLYLVIGEAHNFRLVMSLGNLLI
jgi:hypothetical protein